MKTLKQLTEKFHSVNSEITEDKFPLVERKHKGYKLFHFDKSISSEDVVKEMEKEGYSPATILELLTWEDWNEKDLVVALGSVGEVLGDRGVPCLRRDVSERGLCLGYWVDGWISRFRFLAVRVDNVTTEKVELTNEHCKHKINFCPTCGEKI